MKQYTVDELRFQDYNKIKAFMTQNYEGSEVEGIFWIPIDKSLLNETQAKHKDCAPFYFAVDIEPTKMSCEFLIRTRNRIRCDCMGMASPAQRNWLMETIDSILDQLEIKI